MAMRYSSQFNMSKLKQNLFIRQDRLQSAVAREIREGAKIIMEESKANAPVDTHDLEEAHKIVEGITTAGHTSVSVEVSGSADLEEYAMFMHEGIPNNDGTEVGSLGAYNLREKSLAKQAADPTHHVGSKYLERAVKEKKPIVIGKVKQAVKETF